ncbi:transglycosylase SLT domain-containing protein (plasmid) [Klebsiella sp. WOUb02]|uniref:transglycosylase SLT domain-containing protein n=1 Tax=Klebsiella sp. WOUb02 TaxID=3161071 RepID=UPI003CEC5001
MNKIVLVFTLFIFPVISYAEDCFDMAGRDYKIDPDLLRAISWQESKFVVNAIGRNPVSGYGSGLMQIDSQHFGELSRYGIKSQHILTDACLNIYTGAYFLARAFNKWGVSWDAVGAYNAGFKKTPRQAARRYSYASKIHRYYTAIKASKNQVAGEPQTAMRK